MLNFAYLPSFQKNDIGWPQQPPTEKVLKFNMIFHDYTQKLFFIVIFFQPQNRPPSLLLFTKLVDETQMSNPPEPLCTIIRQNY